MSSENSYRQSEPQVIGIFAQLGHAAVFEAREFRRVHTTELAKNFFGMFTKFRRTRDIGR